MMLCEDRALWNSEQLMLVRDESVGLRAVIAIDDTTLGPGLGGVRRRSYASDDAAIQECRRLAAAMTLKNAVAEIPYGGAKSVILDLGPVADRRALMERFGEFVSRTGGAYLPGVDMGTTVGDLAVMGSAGAEVSCHEEDPSPWTALGVAAAIRAAVAHVDRRNDIDGVTVLIQGAGHVGRALAHDLASDGARILVADVDALAAAALAAEVGGRVVAADQALQSECDVLAPCAIARVASPATIRGMRCRILAGGANDTLADRSCGDLLAARGITYVPDFVANAGGVLQIHARRSGHDDDRLRDDVLRIGERVDGLLHEAADTGATPLQVAETHARLIIDAGRRARGPAVRAHRVAALSAKLQRRTSGMEPCGGWRGTFEGFRRGARDGV
jgi:leucine dehydrogenase